MQGIDSTVWMRVVEVGGPAAIIAVISAVLLFRLFNAHNKFVERVQAATEAREAKVMEFVQNISTAGQADTDACRHLAEAINKLIDYCHRKDGK